MRYEIWNKEQALEPEIQIVISHMFYFSFAFVPAGSFLIRYSWNKARQPNENIPCFVRISSGNKGKRLLPRTTNNPLKFSSLSFILNFNSILYPYIFNPFVFLNFFHQIFRISSFFLHDHSTHWVSKSQFWEVSPIDFYDYIPSPTLLLLLK